MLILSRSDVFALVALQDCAAAVDLIIFSLQ